jgi:putative PIG3 family NAD(P)H quinone oxidoreductase
MRAVYIKQFGDIENLELREIADPPKPTGTQVLVRVHAAGLNRADLLQVKGHYPAPQGYSSELPGLEFAGEVIETGENGNGFNPGDRVMGITAGHAQAEYILAEQSTLARIPDNLSFDEAAAIPEAFITAHDAVFTQSRLAAGETLLVHAVGSGVGLAALQMAKAAGANVIGTSRTADKLERCKEFGLDIGIVVGKEPDFSKSVAEATDGRGADVICDLVGASYFKENLASAALKGRIILVGLTGGATAEFNLGIALSKRLTIRGTVLRARSIEEKAAATEAFADFALPLFENGNIRATVDKVFPAADVREAYRYLASNESFGKVVLEF